MLQLSRFSFAASNSVGGMLDQNVLIDVYLRLGKSEYTNGSFGSSVGRGINAIPFSDLFGTLPESSRPMDVGIDVGKLVALPILLD